MKKVLTYLKSYWLESLLAPLFKLLEAGFELAIPFIISAIIDRGIPSGDADYIVRMGLILVGLALVGLASATSAQYFAAKAAVGLATKLRHALFAHIQRLSYTELDRLGSATLITRMTSDVNQLQSGVNLALRLLLRSPFIVFGALIMAFTIDASCALIFAIIIPVLALIVFSILLVTIPLHKKTQSRLDNVLLLTRENLTGARVLRAFAREDDEISAFEHGQSRLTRLQLRSARIGALMNPLTYIAINLALVLLIRKGAIRVNAGALSQGQVVALINYMGQILVELIKLANLIISVSKAAASGKRLGAILSLRPSMSVPSAAVKPDEEKLGSVAFDHVALRYRGGASDALTDIHFSASRGQIIGIIGGTGSGKSSLVNLIPRFYDASAGSVYVNGADVCAQSPEALRAHIAVVPQHAALFQGSIRENLLWGNPNASDEALLEAVRAAQAEDVLSAKGGLDAIIEQGGANLSGGQRQRLTIARALVRKPEILILDDSSSALDFATDARLRMSIRRLNYQPTVFIVSQRAATVRYADKIIVLDDGQLVGLGAHETLLESCPVYREIVESQLRGRCSA